MNVVKKLIVASSMLAAATAWGAQTVAFLTNVRGDVTVDGGARPTLLAEMTRGQRLVLGRDGQASIMYIASGTEYVLKVPGEYTVQLTEVQGPAGVQASRRDTEWRTDGRVLVQVGQTAAASVRMRSISPVRGPAVPPPAFPEGVVATLQPTFRWKAVEARAPLDFTLHAAGRPDPVHRSRLAGATTLSLPAPLEPGTDYSWTLSAGGQEVGGARFRTLPAEALNRLQARRPGAGSEFTDRLMFAAMLQELGAGHEAREAWAALAKERPDLPELGALAR